MHPLKKSCPSRIILSQRYLVYKVCGVIRNVLLLSALGFAQAALAQTQVERLTQGLTERVSFDVNSFVISGDNPLSEFAAQEILKPYLGEARGIDDIEQAADSFEQTLSDSGFSFYRVTFPPQELSDGTVELLIKRYQIGEVKITGNKHHSDANIKASMPLLLAGEAPSTRRIAKALRVANQSPIKRIRVSLAPGTQPNEINANLAVVDQAPLSMSAWLNNTGNKVSGDYRVGASVAHRNLFGRDHQASLTFITSPEGVDDVQQFAANYRIPLYQLGGSLSFTAVKSDIDTGTVAEVFEVAGKGEVYNAGYSHELGSIGRYHHRVAVQLSDKLFDNDVQFLGQQVLEDVRSRPLTINYSGSWGNGKAVEWSGFASYTANQSGGSFNNARSYNVSRIGAVDNWSKIELGVSYRYTARNWLYSGVVKYSATSDRLITGEQFAVGGANNLRGLNERELRGDEGYLVNLQAWAPPITKTLRAVLFADIARLENNRAVNDEYLTENVSAVGVMMNWNPSSKISASASYGYLLDGIDGATDPTTASLDGDGKLHFNFSYRF